MNYEIYDQLNAIAKTKLKKKKLKNRNFFVALIDGGHS